LNNHDYFNISLKYYNNKPVLSEICVISKPGRKIYCSADKIPLIKNGLGMSIISTSHGILSDHAARTKNLGGEILLKIF
jgi:small subunit ribosomal protein S8